MHVRVGIGLEFMRVHTKKRFLDPACQFVVNRAQKTAADEENVWGLMLHAPFTTKDLYIYINLSVLTVGSRWTAARQTAIHLTKTRACLGEEED